MNQVVALAKGENDAAYSVAHGAPRSALELSKGREVQYAAGLALALFVESS